MADELAIRFHREASTSCGAGSTAADFQMLAGLPLLAA
jgi:hypothetical protein